MNDDMYPHLCAEDDCPWPVEREGERCGLHSPAVAVYMVKASIGGTVIHIAAGIDPTLLRWDLESWVVRHTLEGIVARTLQVTRFDLTVLDYELLGVRDA